MAYYVYGSGEFERLSNFFDMVGEWEVLLPEPIGTSTISAVKARKGRPAMIKVTHTYAIPDGILKAGANDAMVAMGMVPFFALFCKPGTLVLGDEESNADNTVR